jgi:hypothetical protein
MINFKDFVRENTEQGKHWLHVADIDDTLFHTTAKIHVKNQQGQVVQKLTNSEFNTHRLPAGHHYDFTEFRNAEKFNKESKPIVPMINKIKNLHAHISKHHPKSKIIFNTARTDFDNKNKFLDTFKKQGIPIEHIHVHRAGNEKGATSPGQAKNMVLRRHLDSHKYGHVTMYDDSHHNLNHFLQLRHEYPHIKFHAFHVKPNGSFERHRSEDNQ